MDLVLWYYGLWVLSEPNSNLDGYLIGSETFKIPKKKLVPHMILIPNMYPKYTNILLNIYNTYRLHEG